ncbi:DUF3638 domain-containing protein, partial [Gammaproteobacteria bacterium]|nr:DUF3638 domain-containing protein [Gammaproteobacteria bacterium]
MKITYKLLAHVCLDDHVLNACKLEGQNFPESIKHFSQHFENKLINDTGYSTLQEKLTQLSAFASRIQNVSGSSLDATYDEANKIAKSISKLEANKPESYVLMPGGWTTHKGGHAMVYKFFKQGGYLHFTVYNTGGGINHHARKVKDQLDQYYPILTYKAQISDEQWGTFGQDFIDPLVKAQCPNQHVHFEGETMDGNRLYGHLFQKFVNLYGGEIQLPEKYSQDLWTTSQASGTCTQRVLHLLLKELIGNSQKFNQAMLDFKLDTLEQFSKERQSPTEAQKQLIKLSVENVAGLLARTDIQNKSSYKNRLDAINQKCQPKPEEEKAEQYKSSCKPEGIAFNSNSYIPYDKQEVQPNHQQFPKIDELEPENLDSWLNTFESNTNGFSKFQKFKVLEKAIVSLPYGNSATDKYDFLENQTDEGKTQFLANLRKLQNLYFEAAYSFTRRDVYLPRMFLVKAHLLAVTDHLNTACLWKKYDHFQKDEYGKILRYQLSKFDMKHCDIAHLNLGDQTLDNKFKGVFSYLSDKRSAQEYTVLILFSLFSDKEHIQITQSVDYQAWLKDRDTDNTSLEKRAVFFLLDKRYTLENKQEFKKYFQRIKLFESTHHLLDGSYSSTYKDFNSSKEPKEIDLYMLGALKNCQDVSSTRLPAATKACHNLSNNLPGILALSNCKGANNSQSDNDVYLKNHKNLSHSDLQTFKELAYLRNALSAQFINTIDYFLARIGQLKSADQQFYLTSNLFQPDVIDPVVSGDSDSQELEKFEQFIDQGLTYFEKFNQPTKESLFFIQLAYQMASYKDDCPYKMTDLITKIDALIEKKPSDKEVLDSLYLYQFLATVTAVLASKDSGFDKKILQKGFQAYMRVQVSVQATCTLNPDMQVKFDLLKDDFKQFLINQNNLSSYFDNDFYKQCLSDIGYQNIEATYNDQSKRAVYKQDNQTHYIDCVQGLVFNQNNQALVSTPQAILHHPYRQHIDQTPAAKDWDFAYVSADKETYTLKNGHFKFVYGWDHDKPPTVYRKYDDQWWQVSHHNQKKASTLNLSSLNLASSVLSDYEIWQYSNISILALNGQPKFKTGKNRSFQTIEDNPKAVSLLHDEQIKRFEDSNLGYCIGDSNGGITISLPRYGLNFTQLSGGIIEYTDSRNQTYQLLNSKPLVEGSADLQFQLTNSESKIMLLPVQPFYAVDKQSEHSIYYQFKQDINQTVLKDRIEVLTKDDEGLKDQYPVMQGSESFVTFNLDAKGEPIPTSFEQVLLLSYVYLAGKQEQKAWTLLSKTHNQMQGTEKEIQYLRWMIDMLPYHQENDQFEADYQNPALLQCQLKAMSFLAKYQNSGWPDIEFSESTFPAKSQQCTYQQDQTKQSQTFYAEYADRVVSLMDSVDRMHRSLAPYPLADQDLDQLFASLKGNNKFEGGSIKAVYERYLARQAKLHQQESKLDDRYTGILRDRKDKFLNSNGGLKILSSTDATQHISTSNLVQGFKKYGKFELIDTETFKTYQSFTAPQQKDPLFNLGFKQEIINKFNVNFIDRSNKQWEEDFILKTFPAWVRVAASLEDNEIYNALKGRMTLWCQMQLLEANASKSKTNLPLLAHTLWQVLKSPNLFARFKDVEALEQKYLNNSNESERIYYYFYKYLFAKVTDYESLDLKTGSVKTGTYQIKKKGAFLSNLNDQENPQAAPNNNSVEKTNLKEITLPNYTLSSNDFKENIKKNNDNKKEIKNWLVKFQSVDQQMRGALGQDRSYTIKKQDLIKWYGTGSYPDYLPQQKYQDFDQLMGAYLYSNAILKTAKVAFDQDPLTHDKKINEYNNLISEANSGKYRQVVQFQNRAKVLISDKQKELIKSVDKLPDQVKLLQMGGGKTKVILPSLALQQADGEHLVCVMVPPALLEVNAKDLGATTHSQGQTPFRLEFNRQTSVEPADLKNLYKQLEFVRIHKNYVVTTAESMQSLELRFLELLQQDKSNKNSIKELQRILIFLRDRGRFLVDEVHETFCHKHSLNYTIGKPEAVAENVLKHSLDLFKHYNSNAIDKNQSVEKQINALTTSLLESNSQSLLGQLSCIKEKGGEVKKYLLDQKSLNGVTNEKDQQEILAIYKAQLTHFLPFTLTKKYRVNYGPSKSKSDPYHQSMAIPYKGNNVPKEKSQFASEMETINYTIQGYLQSGVSFKQFDRLIRFALEEAEQEQKDQNKSSINDTLLNQQVYQPLINQNLGDIKIDCSKSKQELWSKNKNNSKLIFYFLEKHILPLIKKDSDQLSSNPTNLVDMGKRCVGMSGTPANYHTFHQKLANSDLGDAIKTSNKDVINALQNSSKTNISNLQLCEDKNKYVQELIKNNDGYHALIDINATFQGIENVEVARQISIIKNQWVLYFNQDQVLCGIKVGNPQDGQGEQIVKIGSSDPEYIKQALGVEAKNRFTYFDQAHTTGTDIRQDPNAKALVLVDDQTPLDKCLQGVCRMRSYLVGKQTIDVKVTSGEANMGQLIDQMQNRQTSILQQHHYEAARQKLQGVVRNALLDDLLSKDQSQDMQAKFKNYQSYFVAANQTDYAKQFANQTENKNTDQLLQAEKDRLLNNFEKLYQGEDAQQKKTEITQKMDLVIKHAGAMETQQKVSGSQLGQEAEQEQEQEQEAEQEQEKEQEKQIDFSNFSRKDYVSWTLNSKANAQLSNFNEFVSSSVKEKFHEKVQVSVNFKQTANDDDNQIKYIKPVFSLLYKYDQNQQVVQCIYLTAQETEALVTEVGSSQENKYFIINTAGSLLAGVKPEWVDENEDFHQIREQALFYNGEFDQLRRKETLYWNAVGDNTIKEFFQEDFWRFRVKSAQAYNKLYNQEAKLIVFYEQVVSTYDLVMPDSDDFNALPGFLQEKVKEFFNNCQKSQEPVDLTTKALYQSWKSKKEVVDNKTTDLTAFQNDPKKYVTFLPANEEKRIEAFKVMLKGQNTEGLLSAWSIRFHINIESFKKFLDINYSAVVSFIVDKKGLEGQWNQAISQSTGFKNEKKIQFLKNLAGHEYQYKNIAQEVFTALLINDIAKKDQAVLKSIASSVNASLENLKEVAKQASALTEGASDVFTALLANVTAKQDLDVLKSIASSGNASADNFCALLGIDTAKQNKEILQSIAGSGNASPQNLQEVATQASALAQGAPDVFTALLANETAKQDLEVLKSIASSGNASEANFSALLEIDAAKKDKEVLKSIASSDKATKENLKAVADLAAALNQGAPELFTALLANDTAKQDP